ncbi:hypothetical protein [Nioella nitratireducens]|uniref:hypothetical protein n=1 Tax=Nioella nitratireducens TaxID=1287720 RepID=UPI0013141043|nr:hypothetical protein [Nioella nitratireducens]
MFSIFSNAMKTATRTDMWNAPDHWHRQQQDYRTRRNRRDAERARLRRSLSDTGIR